MADALRFQLYEVNRNVLHAEIELCVRDLAGVADIGEKARRSKAQASHVQEYEAKKDLRETGR